MQTQISLSHFNKSSLIQREGIFFFRVFIVSNKNNIDLNYYNNKMNKCEHSLPIQLFCVSQYCQWKDPGGCSQCIKKYHSHYRQQKIISQPELHQYVKMLTNSQTTSKLNCRTIQQSFYTYLNQLKNELTKMFDLLFKTVINSLGAPYLMKNNLFKSFKKIKNKEYRRLQQKEISHFYHTAKNTNPNQILKEESKLYKEELKRFEKLLSSIQSITQSYQDLLKQHNLTFVHEKQNFNYLTSLIKQTLQNCKQEIPFSQINKKSLEKNENERKEKNQFSLKSANSEEYEKCVSKKSQLQSIISTFYSGTLPSAEKQRQLMQIDTSPNSKINKETPQIEESSNFRFGIMNINTSQKRQNKIGTDFKKPISLQKDVSPHKNKKLMAEAIGKNEKINNEIKFKNGIKPKETEKQKSFLIDMQIKQISTKNASLFATQNIGSQTARDFTRNRSDSVSSVKQDQLMTSRQVEINRRKEILIQMMKGRHSPNKNAFSFEPQRINLDNKKHIFEENRGKQTIKKNERQIKNNSVLVKPTNDNHEFFSKQPNFKKNNSVFTDNRIFHESSSPQSKNSESVNCQKIFPILQMEEIHSVNQASLSGGSMQAINNYFPQNNISVVEKIPIEDFQQKPKEIACSRVIIVPTLQKFPNQIEYESPIRRKSINLRKFSHDRQDFRTQEKTESKIIKKQCLDSKTEQKSEMNEAQQRSVKLLIKSINQKPDEAILSLELALKQSLNNLSAAEYLSYLYLQGQRPKQALGVCNKILDRFEIFNRQNEELLLNLLINKGAALNMLGRYSQTIVLLQKVTKPNQKDTLLKNLGDAYYFSSQYDKAITHYQKVVRLSPNYDESYYNMAVCYYLQQKYLQAKQALDRAIDLAPRNVEYLQFHNYIKEKTSNK